MSEALDLSKEGPPKVIKRRRSGKKGGSSQYATVPLPPCKVCGGLATGYHFGVITCEACKAFFRRALIHKQDYKCARNDNCDIVGKKLSNCSACRLRKCFDIGMSQGGVRKGRYSIAVRTKAIVEARASEGKDPASITPSQVARSGSGENLPSSLSSSSSSSLSKATESSPSGSSDVTPSPRPELTSPNEPTDFRRNLELELLIDALVGCQEAVYPTLAKQYERNLLSQAQLQIYKEHKRKEEAFGRLFGNVGTVSTDEYQQIFAETGIDLDDRLAHFNSKGKTMEESIAQYVNFAKIIPGFKNLNPKDVSNLLKASHLEFWIFGNYMLFNKGLEVAVSWDGKHNSSSKQIEKFFSRDWMENCFEFADRIQKLNLSLEEIVLIRVIILTFTDRCKLREKSQIQILQEKFLDCLTYQLRRKHQNPNRRLCKIFDVLLAIRNFSDMNLKENKIFLNKWGFAIHEFPLWKEMLSHEDDV